MKGGRTVHKIRSRIVEENSFPLKKWTRVARINRIDVYEFTNDGDDAFNLNNLVGGSELELQLVPIRLLGDTEVVR